MAHDEHRKAQAMALLALGNSPRYVARKCGIPLMTVRRWKKEVFATIRIELPDLSELARQVTTLFPGCCNRMAQKRKRV